MLAAAKSAGQAKERALANGEATSSASRVRCEYFSAMSTRADREAWAAFGAKRAAAAALEAAPASGVALTATPRTPAAGARRLAAGTRPQTSASVAAASRSDIAAKLRVWGRITEHEERSPIERTIRNATLTHARTLRAKRVPPAHRRQQTDPVRYSCPRAHADQAQAHAGRVEPRAGVGRLRQPERQQVRTVLLRGLST